MPAPHLLAQPGHCPVPEMFENWSNWTLRRFVDTKEAADPVDLVSRRTRCPAGQYAALNEQFPN